MDRPQQKPISFEEATKNSINSGKQHLMGEPRNRNERREFEKRERKFEKAGR